MMYSVEREVIQENIETIEWRMINHSPTEAPKNYPAIRAGATSVGARTIQYTCIRYIHITVGFYGAEYRIQILALPPLIHSIRLMRRKGIYGVSAEAWGATQYSIGKEGSAQPYQSTVKLLYILQSYNRLKVPMQRLLQLIRKSARDKIQTWALVVFNLTTRSQFRWPCSQNKITPKY